jgi:hypothetical protein
MTIFRIGYENNNNGRTIAWALEHPGCFAYGGDQRAAERNFPEAAGHYIDWVASHGGSWLRPGQDIQLNNEETFDVYFVDGSFERVEPGRGSMVESFFRHDWKPLTASDVERALELLAWSHADLLAVVQGLTPDQRSRKLAGERWDINGILNHIGGAEWWYQERLGYPFPAREEDLPSDPATRLQLVREHFTDLLPRLQGVNQVVGWDGELWSPRKVLRRLVWHERDHTDHIRKLI